MKKFTLSACALAALLALSAQPLAAQTAQQQPSRQPLTATHITPLIGKIQAKLVPTAMSKREGVTDPNAARTAACQRRDAAQPQADATQQPKRVGMKAQELPYTQQLDSIVTSVEGTGALASRNLFDYYPETGLLKRATSETFTDGRWQEDEVREYEWDKDGYCLVQQITYPSSNYGERVEYRYNDQKLGIWQHSMTYTDGVWSETMKGEYEYDERGNMTSEKTYAWNAEQQDWTPDLWNKAEYDQHNFMSHREAYYYEDGAWKPNGDMQDVIYTDYGCIKQLVNTLWEEDKQQWQPYQMWRQQWDDKRHCTKQEILYYNLDKQDWVGCYEWYGIEWKSKYTDLMYDPATDIKTSETFYELEDPDGEYVKQSYITTTITQVGDKEYRAESNEYFINDGVKQLVDVTISQYLDASSLPEEQRVGKLDFDRYLNTYKYEKKLYNEEDGWTPLFEYVDTYTDDLQLKSSRMYYYSSDADHKKLADISEDYIFDDHHNVIDSYYCNGQGTSEDDWVYATRFTYDYDCDTVRVGKFQYVWDGADWQPSYGNTVDYDFSVPVEQVLVWIVGDPYHKVNATRSYTTTDGVTECLVSQFYYSDLTNAISALRDEDVALLTLHGRTLTLQRSGQVTLCNALGQAVLVASGHAIDLSQLPAGIYLVRTEGGNVAKVALR